MVKAVREGHSLRSAAAHWGFSLTTAARWVERSPDAVPIGSEPFFLDLDAVAPVSERATW